MKTALDTYLEMAMEAAMADPKMRVLLWYIVTDRLHVFDSGYSHNATAYSLLAKKEAGLQLLTWMKTVSPEGTYRAESEFNQLITEEQKGEENNG